MVNRLQLQNFFKHRLLLVSLATLCLVGAAGVFIYQKTQHTDASPSVSTDAKDAVKPTNTIDYSPASTTDNAASEERKNNPDSAAATLGNGPTVPDNKPSVGITITRAGKDPTGNTFQVATIIEGTSSGTCTISATRQGQPTITRQAAVALQGNSYTCPVVSIPISDFPEKGKWNIRASVSVDGQATSTEWAANPVSI